MKKFFLQYAMTLVAGLAIFASCEKPIQKDPDPVFPETVINKTVSAGESVNINIEPNLAWEVSISGEGSGNYFWIDDDNMKATKKVSKEAGPAVITIVFSEDEEFDVNRVCDVTLTMAGQSKKIATLTRPSLGRTFEIMTAAAGDSDFTQDFAAAQTATLVTFPGVATYSVPVRVVTNYAWDIALPEWLKATTADAKPAELTGGQAGTTDFFLTAVLDMDVVQGAEGTVKFIDSNNSAAVEEFKVTLPSFENRMEVEVNSMSFNREGHLLMGSGSYQPVPAVAYVLAVEGFVVRALEFDGTWHALEYADWVNAETGVYDETAGVLQTIDVQITVDENPGKKRVADVFIFPASMTEVAVEDICDPNAPECGFNAEYEPYYIGRLVQEGEVPPYLTPISSPDMMEEVGTYFTVLEPKGDDNILQWDFAAAPVYQKITYTGEWSADEASFDCTEPFAYVKLYEDTDYPYGMFSAEVTEDEDYWISFVTFGGENMKGRFNMNYVPESPIHTAAVFYDENDNILAAVLVEFASVSTGGGDDSPFKVTMGSAEIVKLGMDSEVYQILYGNWSVSEVYQVTTGDANLTLSTALDIWDVFGIDPITWGDLVEGPMSPSIPNMYFNLPEGSPRTEAIYVFKGENGVNLAALHYIYDPAAGSDEAPFAFAYPDYVQGATLQPATGDILEAIKGEFYGISEDCVYELKYTTPEPMMAMVTVPSMPAFEAAWNNYDGLPDYWLTYEQMDDKSILVYMNPDKAEKGQTDYFVFKAADGYSFAAVLVCVYDPAE